MLDFLWNFRGYRRKWHDSSEQFNFVDIKCWLWFRYGNQLSSSKFHFCSFHKFLSFDRPCDLISTIVYNVSDMPGSTITINSLLINGYIDLYFRTWYGTSYFAIVTGKMRSKHINIIIMWKRAEFYANKIWLDIPSRPRIFLLWVFFFLFWSNIYSIIFDCFTCLFFRCLLTFKTTLCLFCHLNAAIFCYEFEEPYEYVTQWELRYDFRLICGWRLRSPFGNTINI